MPKIIKDLERKILTAARELFIRQGYDKADIRQIAAGADIAVGTMYNYYRNKEELFAAVLRSCLEEMWQEINTEIRGHDAEDRLRSLLEALQSQMDGEESTVWRHIMRNTADRDSSRQAIADVKKIALEAMSELVERMEVYIRGISEKYGRSTPAPAQVHRLALTLVLTLFPLTKLLPAAEAALTIDYLMRLVKGTCLLEEEL